MQHKSSRALIKLLSLTYGRDMLFEFHPVFFLQHYCVNLWLGITYNDQVVFKCVYLFFDKRSSGQPVS